MIRKLLSNAHKALKSHKRWAQSTGCEVVATRERYASDLGPIDSWSGYIQGYSGNKIIYRSERFYSADRYQLCRMLDARYRDWLNGND